MKNHLNLGYWDFFNEALLFKILKAKRTRRFEEKLVKIRRNRKRDAEEIALSRDDGSRGMQDNSNN